MAAKEFHCTTCGLTGAWSCLQNSWHTDDGEPVDAIPYDGLSGDRCPECGVRSGGYHHVGCSLEEIPEQLQAQGALLPDPNVPDEALPAPSPASRFTGPPAGVGPRTWKALLVIAGACAGMLVCEILAATVFLMALVY